jgi:type I restriction enzyme R subunit
LTAKEATARIKINKLLEAAGWRFFPEGTSPANIRLEPSIAIKPADIEALGSNFEKISGNTMACPRVPLERIVRCFR